MPIIQFVIIYFVEYQHQSVSLSQPVPYYDGAMRTNFCKHGYENACVLVFLEFVCETFCFCQTHLKDRCVEVTIFIKYL